MKKVILTIGILAGVSSTFAQVGRVGINTDDPKVIKEDDHTVDEFKYFVLDNARELRLKA